MRKQALLRARFRLERDFVWLALSPHIGSNISRAASIEQCQRPRNLIFTKAHLGLPSLNVQSPARDSKISVRNNIIIAFVVGLIVLLLFGCTSPEPLLPDPMLGSPGQEVVVQGQVIENDLGCEIDAASALRVRTNGHESVVVYHYGEWPPCPNEPAIRAGLMIEAGDTIEAFGIVGEEGGYLSTCDSAEYYIKILQ